MPLGYIRAFEIFKAIITSWHKRDKKAVWSCSVTIWWQGTAKSGNSRQLA
jgi:hypothetical protein